MEAQVVLQLIDVLLLTLSDIVALADIMREQLVLSPELLVALADLVDVTVQGVDFRVSVLNVSLGRLNIFIDFKPFLLSIQDSLLQTIHFTLVMRDNLLLLA